MLYSRISWVLDLLIYSYHLSCHYHDTLFHSHLHCLCSLLCFFLYYQIHLISSHRLSDDLSHFILCRSIISPLTFHLVDIDTEVFGWEGHFIKESSLFLDHCLRAYSYHGKKKKTKNSICAWDVLLHWTCMRYLRVYYVEFISWWECMSVFYP